MTKSVSLKYGETYLFKYKKTNVSATWSDRHFQHLYYDKEQEWLMLWDGNSKNRWMQIEGNVLQREENEVKIVFSPARLHGFDVAH